MNSGEPHPLPIGVGLRHAHHADLLACRPALDFVEVHAENFFAEGGAAPGLLDEVRCHYAVSLHGVSLSLGSACGLDESHLARLATLVKRIDPLLLSDHAAFARAPLSPGGSPVHAADLLPIALTPASLAILARNVDRAQAVLGRRLLVENLSAYLAWADDSLEEPAFLGELCRRTGCGLLLDLNNLVVNALNHGAADPAQWAAHWISRLPTGVVGQVHLAGHSPARPGRCIVDDHGQPVGEAVWQVYADTLRHCGPVPTLIEWDTDLPPLQTLLDQAQQAIDTARWALARDEAQAPQAAAMPFPAPPPSPAAATASAPHDHEAGRQQALLRALFAAGSVEQPHAADELPGVHPRWVGLPGAATPPAAAPMSVTDPPTGLATPSQPTWPLLPYRRNACASAARALRTAYPTVAAMLGDEPLRSVAWALWQAHPPHSGDLADWGSELPSWLAQQEQLQPWPWLPDSAQLDWTVHRCARAADAKPEPQTVSLLGELPAERLRLQLLPGLAVLCSDWPIATLHAVHQAAGADGAASATLPPALTVEARSLPAAGPARRDGTNARAPEPESIMQPARAAIARKRAECVCVFRRGWSVEVEAIDRATAAWMADLLAGMNLAQALQRAQARAGDVGQLDLTAWLAQALRQGWIWRAVAAESDAVDESIG